MSSQADRILVVGMDPSLRNWGLAKAWLDLSTMTLDIVDLHVIQPVIEDNKQVRNNSKDLSAATQLAMAAIRFIHDARAVFVEVPHGSQSARAMASYGVCVGILGTMRAHGMAFFELSESEVKGATIPGIKKPTKSDMIHWATSLYPLAPWATHNGVISAARAEHQADAVGAIHAGLKLSSFQQMLALTRRAA